MLVPSKHERLEKNILVIGGDIINFLRKKSYNVENLFQELKIVKSINLDQFYNTVTFLWLSELIEVNKHNISLRSNNASS